MDKNRSKMILETLMGDPVLSFYVNSKGVAIGTALGRVSSYVFEYQKYNSNNKRPTDGHTSVSYKDYKEICINNINNTSNNNVSNGNNHEYNNESNTNQDNNYKDRSVLKTPLEADVPSDLNSVGDQHFDLESNPLSCDASIIYRYDNMELSGKYYVFASYSDEPINALFIHDKYLVSLVGLNTVNVYNVKNYTLEKQMSVSYMLNLSGANMYNKYSNYKQVLQSNENVLMICNKFVLLVDLLKVVEGDSINYKDNNKNKDDGLNNHNRNNNNNNDNNNKEENNNTDTNNDNNSNHTNNKDNNEVKEYKDTIDSSRTNKDNLTKEIVNELTNSLNNSREKSLNDRFSRFNLNFGNNRIYTRLNVSNNLLNSNVLTYDHPNIVTVQYSHVDDKENEHQKVISLYEIVDNSVGLINSIEIADKKYNLINQCKLWNTSLVVVLDYVNIHLYSNQDNTSSSTSFYNNNTSNSNNSSNGNNNSETSSDNSSTTNRVHGYRFDVNGKFELKYIQKMNSDILSLNCSLKNHLILLNKKSKIKILNKELVTLYSHELHNSTFELGWSYNLLFYNDYLIYNSDEGVFMYKLPYYLD